MSTSPDSSAAFIGPPSPTKVEGQKPPHAPEQMEAAREVAKQGAEAVGKRVILLETAGKIPEDLTPGQRGLAALEASKRAAENAAEGKVISLGLQQAPEDVADGSKDAAKYKLTGTPIIARGTKIDDAPRDAKILSIAGVVRRGDTVNAQCIFEYTDGAGRKSNAGGAPVELPLQNIIDGQIVAEKAVLLENLQGEAKTMAEYYITQLEGGDQSAAANERLFSDATLSTTEETILKTAEATGFVTRTDIEGFIESRMPRIADGETPTTDQQAEITRLETMKENIGDSLILTPDILQKIITNDANVNIAEVTQGLAETEGEATELLEQLDDAKQTKPNSAETQALQDKYNKLMQLRRNLQTLKEVANLTEEGNLQRAIMNYGKMLENGEIPEEAARKLGEGFRTGNMQAVLEGIAEPTIKPNESQEAFEERQKRHAKMVGLREGAMGIGLLALFAILELADSCSN